MNLRNRSYDPVREKDESAAREEQLDRLREVLHQLSDFDRTIVNLRYFEKLTNRECAERLGLTDMAASMRYLRAMRRLRKLMNEASG